MTPQRALSGLVVAAGAAVTIAAGGLFAPAALAAAATPASQAAPARGHCDSPHIGDDGRVHVWCHGPGHGELHVECWPGIWRVAGASVPAHSSVEIALGCGPASVKSYYATMSG